MQVAQQTKMTRCCQEDQQVEGRSCMAATTSHAFTALLADSRQEPPSITQIMEFDQSLITSLLYILIWCIRFVACHSRSLCKQHGFAQKGSERIGPNLLSFMPTHFATQRCIALVPLHSKNPGRCIGGKVQTLSSEKKSASVAGKDWHVSNLSRYPKS